MRPAEAARSGMMSAPRVNSRAWWDAYFAEHWDAREGGAQTRHFMERIVANLPPFEKRWLLSTPLEILDWGCACGEGVDVLARAFPQSRVVGVDFSSRAVEEARRRFPKGEFILTDEGKLPGEFDVVVSSNCLEHFADPIDALGGALRSCRKLLIVLVPDREHPLSEHHLSQFRPDSFPESVGGFRRLHCDAIEVDPRFWKGKQLLVIYGSTSYVVERATGGGERGEQRKWDEYYGASSADVAEYVKAFGAELAARISELVPRGGSILEAGCGEGSQSLEIARLGRHKLTLLDFSETALARAKELFEREGLAAHFVREDILHPAGKPEHDLVFNVGVLEHYPFEQQVALARAMASRSRNHVLIVVPNPLCYWYWMWRIQKAGVGEWPYGKEIPSADLAAVFASAGLNLLGQAFMAERWTEAFIGNLRGVDDALLAQVLLVHRSPLIPRAEKSHLLAALGSVKSGRARVPPGWSAPLLKEDHAQAEARSALADALALRIRAEQRIAQLEPGRDQEVRSLRALLAEREGELELLRRGLAAREAESLERGRAGQALRDQLAEKDAAARALQAQLAEAQANLAALRRELSAREEEARSLYLQLTAIYESTGWALLKPLYWLRHILAPKGSRRERAAQAGMHLLRRARCRAHSLLAAVKRSLRTPPPRRADRGETPAESGPATPSAEGHSAVDVPGLVSVVLPVYNQASLLRESIQSVLAQTYANLELIVINDGSTDGVEAVLDEFVSDPRVRVLTQPNQKLPRALSNAFEFARGEFWTWTSADNLMEPEQLSTLVASLRGSPDAAMVYADYLAVDDRGEPLRDPGFRPQNRRTPDSPETHLPRTTERLNVAQDNFIGACFLYRGWVGRLLGEYEPDLGVEDYDYWMRVNGLFRIKHLGTDQLLYRYRVHANSLNARAAELGIPERVQRLMIVERERRGFYQEPWAIHADAPTLDWLRKLDARPHSVAEWKAGSAAGAGPGKCLLLIQAESLPFLVASGVPSGACVAVWFGEDARAPYLCRTEVQETADVCFAPDPGTASRLALFTRNVFEGRPGRELLDVALAFANNRVFYGRAHPPSASRRRPPKVYLPARRTLRVVLQVNDFTQGGMEQAVLHLAQCLEREGLKTALLVLGHHGQAARKAREAGLTVLSLPAEQREEQYRRLLESERADLVSAHYSLFGAAIASELGIPFVQTLHNTYAWLSPQQIAAYRENDRHTAAYACVSGDVAFYSDVRLGLPAGKMVLLPNGVDTTRFRDARDPEQRDRLRGELGLGPDDFVFLNVASIYPPKAQKLTVQALARVVRECPRAKVVFLGSVMDEAYHQQVRRAIADDGLGGAVVFAGLRDEVVPFFRMADAFLLPSYWEGWSLALAEALCAGLPIVATDVGGAREQAAVPGVHLVRPPFGSVAELEHGNLPRYPGEEQPRFVSELAQAMVIACRRPERPKLSEDHLRRLDWRHAYAAYARLFEWLVQKGDPAAARPWLRRMGHGCPHPTDGGACDER